MKIIATILIAMSVASTVYAADEATPAFDKIKNQF